MPALSAGRRSLVTGRRQPVHSQVLHYLPVVIPGVSEEDPRCIESRSPQLLDIRIGDLLQQLSVGRSAYGPVRVREGVLQITDNLFLARKILRTSLSA